LARDVERYLHDEPVQACPPSAIYRFRKFARRNKTLLAAGGAIAATLVVGLGLSTWQYFRATTESARAKVVSEFLQEILASSDPEQVKGAKYTVRELLDDFSAGLGDQLVGEPEVEADIHGTIGRAYHGLGLYDRAEVHHKKAIDLRRELFGSGDERIVDNLVDYAWSLDGLGRYQEAETYAREALAICRQHDSDPHLTILTLRTLLQHLIRQSRLAEAEEVANEALALGVDESVCDVKVLGGVLNSLADVKLTQGKYYEAEKFARKSVEFQRRRHAGRHPQTAHGLWSLGRALKGQQKLAEAEMTLREALAIFRECYTSEHPTIQGISQEQAAVLEAKGDRANAEALIHKESDADNGQPTTDK
jgi:tetratricopeptide (TPR) repeat protein